MKKFLLMIAIAGSAAVANAQSASRTVSGGTSFSVGLEAGIPIGQFPKGYTNPYSSFIGASLQVENRPATELGLTLNLGYLSYNVKSAYQGTGGGNSTGFIPLMGGVKYYFSPGVYAHAQLGAAFGTATGAGTSFAYSPGLGFNLSPKIDAELKYTAISNSSATLGGVGIRLAYNF